MSKTGELISCHFKDIAFVAVWSVLKWHCVTETNVGLINRPSPAGVPHLFVLHFSPRWWRFQGDPQGRAARRRFAFAAGCGQGKLVPMFFACLTFRTAFLCPSPGCWLPARPWGSRNCMGICGIQLLWGRRGERRETDLCDTRPGTNALPLKSFSEEVLQFCPYWPFLEHRALHQRSPSPWQGTICDTMNANYQLLFLFRISCSRNVASCSQISWRR